MPIYHSLTLGLGLDPHTRRPHGQTAMVSHRRPATAWRRANRANGRTLADARQSQAPRRHPHPTHTLRSTRHAPLARCETIARQWSQGTRTHGLVSCAPAGVPPSSVKDLAQQRLGRDDSVVLSAGRAFPGIPCKCCGDPRRRESGLCPVDADTPASSRATFRIVARTWAGSRRSTRGRSCSSDSRETGVSRGGPRALAAVPKGSAEHLDSTRRECRHRRRAEVSLAAKSRLVGAGRMRSSAVHIGTANTFSYTRIPARLPGSIAAATSSTSDWSSNPDDAPSHIVTSTSPPCSTSPSATFRTVPSAALAMNSRSSTRMIPWSTRSNSNLNPSPVTCPPGHPAKPRALAGVGVSLGALKRSS